MAIGITSTQYFSFLSSIHARNFSLISGTPLPSLSYISGEVMYGIETAFSQCGKIPSANSTSDSSGCSIQTIIRSLLSSKRVAPFGINFQNTEFLIHVTTAAQIACPFTFPLAHGASHDHGTWRSGCLSKSSTIHSGKASLKANTLQMAS